MNINVLNILKQITAQYGEEVLEDPRRLKAFFSDLAKDEPKPLRTAFGKCVESGFYRILKDTATPEERREVIDRLARRLRDEEGLDIALCAEALELLAAAIFGEGQIAPLPETAPAKQNAAPPPPAAPVCAGCRAELKAQWKSCPYCGTPVQGAAQKKAVEKQPYYGKIHSILVQYRNKLESLKHCRSCGMELQVGWKACPTCGTLVQGADEPAPALSAAVSSSGGAGYGIGLIDPPPAKPCRKRSPPKQQTAPQPQPAPPPTPPPAKQNAAPQPQPAPPPPKKKTERKIFFGILGAGIFFYIGIGLGPVGLVLCVASGALIGSYIGSQIK
jgi:predicted RNA-binding Zn-ribbon protein involved in translation (DUF1610 family)